MTRHLVLILGALALLVACDTGNDSDAEPDVSQVADTAAGPDVQAPDGMSVLDELEQGWVLSLMPGALYKKSVDIPLELLNDQDYLSGANASFAAIYDESETLLGYMRRIFSPVACVLEECYPVEFVILYDDAQGFLHVTSKGYGVENRDFMKNTVKGGHVPFTDDDRVLLNTLTADPPEALVAVDDYHDLCDVENDPLGNPVSAATLPAYEDYTIKGAVFTVWLVINYRLETDAILLSEAP